MIDFKRALAEFELEIELKVLKRTRNREYIDARAAFFYYLRVFGNYRLKDIVDEVEKNTGWRMNHATVLHSINCYPNYSKYDKDLDSKFRRIVDALKSEKDKITYIKDIVSRLRPRQIAKIEESVLVAYEDLRDEIREQIEQEEREKQELKIIKEYSL